VNDDIIERIERNSWHLGRLGLTGTSPTQCDKLNKAIDVDKKAIRAERAELIEALEDCIKLIEALMPGVKHIALQDYRLLNETPMKVNKILAKSDI
jgi:hypothetical protein